MDEEYQNLKRSLQNYGYDEKSIELALKNAKHKNIESCIDYILRYETAQYEAQRRKFTPSIDEKSPVNLDNEKKIELFKQCRAEWNNSRIFHEIVKQKIEQDKKEYQEMQNLYKNPIIKTEPIVRTITEDDCQIRVRFFDGLSEVFIFNKDDDCAKLYDVIKNKCKGKSFKVYDLQNKKLYFKKVSMKELGLFPTAMVFVKKN